jgi:hypothetical protein
MRNDMTQRQAALQAAKEIRILRLSGRGATRTNRESVGKDRPQIQIETWDAVQRGWYCSGVTYTPAAGRTAAAAWKRERVAALVAGE